MRAWGHDEPLQAAGDVRSARLGWLRRGARARRHPVRARNTRGLPDGVRPDLGARQVDHATSRREPRVRDTERRRLLRLLRPGGRPARARAGTPSTSARGTSSRSTRIANTSVGVGSDRHRSGGCTPTSARIRRDARSRSGITRGSRRARTAPTPAFASSGRSCTRSVRTSFSSGTTTTTSASHRRRPPARATYGAGSGSSSSAPAARAFDRSRRSRRTASADPRRRSECCA